MKKIYFALIAFAAFFMTVDAAAQVSVGAGYNHNVMIDNLYGERDTEGMDGFYLEATYDWDFLDRQWGILGFQPGLRFSYAGNSESEEMMGLKTRATFNETYFDVPLNVKYSYPIGRLKLSAFAGPVLSFGLTSSTKASVKGDGVDYSSRLNMYTGKFNEKGETGSGLGSATDSWASNYSRFDVKLGVGVGVSFADRLSLKLGYNIGLANRYTGEADYYIRTGVFYLGLGISL